MNGVALVVESDPFEASRLSRWLEKAGLDVVACPGPSTPEFTCIGGRGGRCPLAAGADFVVLDLRLASDDEMTGTPGWQLLLYYIGLGLPVVALVGQDDPVKPSDDDDVAVVRRPASPFAVLDAARTLLRKRSREHHPAR